MMLGMLPPWIDVKQAAMLLGKNEAAVRQLASRHHWQRIRVGKRVWYATDQVLDTKNTLDT